VGNELFGVRMQYKKRPTFPVAFGPFDKPEDAVRCVVVLAGRDDVLAATIVSNAKGVAND